MTTPSLAARSAFAALAALLLVAPSARAQDAHGTQVPPPPPSGTPGTTTVVAPPGSDGVTVVAPTRDGGTVTATGCRAVTVHGSETWVLPDGSPCPQYEPYRPYQSEGAPMPARRRYYESPRYMRDTERSAAVIASAVTFGVGGAATGIIYLAERGDTCTEVYSSSGQYTGSSCHHNSAVSELVWYGAVVALTPSIPRFVVGDTSRGLIFTGVRAASILVAGLVDWGRDDHGNENFEGPLLLGFVVPVALGIIDLATTPHREDLEPAAPPTVGITSVAPAMLSDRNGTHGAMLALSGRF
jgi:hypothetical protein